jgi:dipeptidyl aminopeptidase/acylaminoacyl peptidase
MTDERVDALIRRLDVESRPDPEFVTRTVALLRPRVRAARVQDMSRIGRLRRDLRLAVQLPLTRPVSRPIAIAVLVLLPLLAVIAALGIAGALLRSGPPGNGPLVIVLRGGLQAIDVDTGSSREIVSPGENAHHVSRSPDGRLIAYWKVEAGGEELTFIGTDGRGIRRVSEESPVAWGGCIDTWSEDSRYLASEVTVGGAHRILIADSVTGTGRLLTPDGMTAHCPLWSPDGRWVAFTEDEASGPSILAVIRTDGTGLHGVSGDTRGNSVAGPNTWSEDGTWIYFTTGDPDLANWRVNVSLGTSTRLTDQVGETAVASSPDGRLISFIVGTTSAVGWDLWIADSDGTNAHRLLADAMSLGWSSDGRYILTWWRPIGGNGGVAVVSPDGSELRVVVPADIACVDADRICDVGWGQPRP